MDTWLSLDFADLSAVEDIVNPTVQKTRPCQHTLFLNFAQLRDLGWGGRVNFGVNDVLWKAVGHPYFELEKPQINLAMVAYVITLLILTTLHANLTRHRGRFLRTPSLSPNHLFRRLFMAELVLF